jgi:hypothetical protein
VGNRVEVSGLVGDKWLAGSRHPFDYAVNGFIGQIFRFSHAPAAEYEDQGAANILILLRGASSFLIEPVEKPVEVLFIQFPAFFHFL